MREHSMIWLCRNRKSNRERTIFWMKSLYFSIQKCLYIYTHNGWLMRPFIRLELRIIDIPLIQAIIKSNANNMKHVQNIPSFSARQLYQECWIYNILPWYFPQNVRPIHQGNQFTLISSIYNNAWSHCDTSASTKTAATKIILSMLTQHLIQPWWIASQKESVSFKQLSVIYAIGLSRISYIVCCNIG